MTGQRRAGPGSRSKAVCWRHVWPSRIQSGLVPLGLPDLVRSDQHLLGALCRDEQRAVVIGEDDVSGADQVRTEPRGDQRLGLPLVQPHRPGRVAAVAEDRKADRGEFRRVPVQAPHHQGRHPGGPGLQYRQVANACLVQAAAIVDGQHIAGFGPSRMPPGTRPRCRSAARAGPARRSAGRTRPPGFPEGAARSGTLQRTHASATSGVGRSANAPGMATSPGPVPGTAGSTRAGGAGPHDPTAARTAATYACRRPEATPCDYPIREVRRTIRLIARWPRRAASPWRCA